VPNHVKLGFVADQDVWINSGIPAVYKTPQLVFTHGYSIENDVFCDGNLTALLTAPDIGHFEEELEKFLSWYALFLSRHLSDSIHSISLHPDQVLEPGYWESCLSLQPGETYPEALRIELKNDYRRLLRGKSLLALLIRSTNRRPGQPRHNTKGLLETVAARPGPLLLQTESAIAKIFT